MALRPGPPRLHRHVGDSSRTSRTLPCLGRGGSPPTRARSFVGAPTHRDRHPRHRRRLGREPRTPDAVPGAPPRDVRGHDLAHRHPRARRRPATAPVGAGRPAPHARDLRQQRGAGAAAARGSGAGRPRRLLLHLRRRRRLLPAPPLPRAAADPERRSRPGTAIRRRCSRRWRRCTANGPPSRSSCRPGRAPNLRQASRRCRR